MYQNLNVFRTANAMASHAGARQAVVAVNIANADTPEYRAKAIAPFVESYRTGGGSVARTTRPGHMSSASPATDARAQNTKIEPSPNGNSVSLETEMLAAVEVEREHNRALAIYRHALGIIRSSIAR